MEAITYRKLTLETFDPHALDGFVRRQQVTRCWRQQGDALVLRDVCYTEDWSLDRRRQAAGEVREILALGGAAYGALLDGTVIGFAALSPERSGSRGQYLELTTFQVSAPFRGHGIGRELFRLVRGEAKARGAGSLYISAHSAFESIAVYRRLGCIPAREINPVLAAAEPYDLQLECPL